MNLEIRICRLPMLRFLEAVLLVVILGAGAQAVAALPYFHAGQLTVTVAGASADGPRFAAVLRPPARRVLLPSASLTDAGGGAGMFAVSPTIGGPTPQVFVLVQAAGELRGEVLPASPGGLAAPANPIRHARWQPRALPPCIAWQALFIAGVGPAAVQPVVVHVWADRGAAGSLLVEPRQHALDLRPALAFSSREVADRVDATDLALRIETSAGRKPVLLLAIARRGEHYETALFTVDHGSRRWQPFAGAQAGETEFRFYALDDDPAWRSACRSPARREAAPRAPATPF